MPKKFDIRAHEEKVRNHELARIRKGRDRYLESLKDSTIVDLSNTPSKTGDRTDNTPPLRIHARQSLRFDKELNTRTYRTDAGKYFFRDVRHTLAVITKARMKMASDQDVKHPVDEDGKSPFLLT